MNLSLSSLLDEVGSSSQDRVITTVLCYGWLPLLSLPHPERWVHPFQVCLEYLNGEGSCPSSWLMETRCLKIKLCKQLCRFLPNHHSFLGFSFWEDCAISHSRQIQNHHPTFSAPAGATDSIPNLALLKAPGLPALVSWFAALLSQPSSTLKPEWLLLKL